LLRLDFHPFTNSARIEYEAERRVFLIRKEGFLRNKTVLCNEYGIRLGQILMENKEKVIELNGEKFTYTIQNNPAPELIVYNLLKEKPLVVCGFNITKDKWDKTLFESVQSSLLLALCWYMFSPATHELMLEYAQA
jgi:hypothetical protein